jgi:hypothetical protein
VGEGETRGRPCCGGGGDEGEAASSSSYMEGQGESEAPSLLHAEEWPTWVRARRGSCTVIVVACGGRWVRT